MARRSSSSLAKSNAGYADQNAILYFPRPRMLQELDYLGPRLEFLGCNGRRFTSALWSTPRRGAWGVSVRNLNKRATRDLATQLVAERQTWTYVKEELKISANYADISRHLFPNPEFVEWIMGLPIGWTRVSFT